MISRASSPSRGLQNDPSVRFQIAAAEPADGLLVVGKEDDAAGLGLP